MTRSFDVYEVDQAYRCKTTKDFVIKSSRLIDQISCKDDTTRSIFKVMRAGLFWIKPNRISKNGKDNGSDWTVLRDSPPVLIVADRRSFSPKYLLKEVTCV